MGAGVLKEWETFYFMLGSAAVGLIGLLFVVVTLTAGFDRAQTTRGSHLYLTPTVLHLAVVFTISAVAIAPGLPLWLIALIVGGSALVGVFSAIRSAIGIRQPPPPGIDLPDWTDFWMYGVSLAAIHAAIFAAAIGLGFEDEWAPAAISALLLVLILFSIRNAWDLLTWIAPRSRDSGAPPVA